MGDFLNTKINNDVSPRKVHRDVTPRSQTSQGMRSTRLNSQQQARTQSRARSRNDTRAATQMAYRSQLGQYDQGPMVNMNSTITYLNGYAHMPPGMGPQKFATAKTLRLKRRNITITDGVTTPATLFTPAKTPTKTDAPSVQL